MLKKTVLISTILVASAGAQAQTSATFSVAGTINPPSCALSVNGDMPVDFGVMKAPAARAKAAAGALDATKAHYELSKTDVAWSVVCTAAMPVNLVLGDLKTGMVAPFDGKEAERYGLDDGATTPKPIGSVSVALGAVSKTKVKMVTGGADVAITNYVWGPKTGPISTLATGVVNLIPNRAVGFSTGSAASLWVAEARGVFDLTLYLQKSKVDALTSDLKFNSTSTLSLVYL